MEIETNKTPDEPCCGSDDVVLSQADTHIILEWWQGLQKRPGEKAKLRACRHLNEATSTCATELQHRLPGHDAGAVMALATLLAQVDENEEETKFICRLGFPSTRPAFSELHFSRLRHSKTLDELLPRLRRAILLLGRSVQVASLAECVLTWSDVHLPHFNAKPDQAARLAEKWQREYRPQN